MIIENHVKYNRPLVLIYVDFLKAFDLLHTDVIWQELRDLQVEEKIANNLKNLHENLEIFVKTTIGEEFVISSEADVKQGDALNTCIPYPGFADDLVSIAPRIHKAQKMLEKLTYQISQFGIKINQKKHILWLEIDPVAKLNGEMLEKVETYEYLGQIIFIMLKDHNINELKE
uniref:Reverse transcriptase domain-containing protein n=1 Tax=Strongyloides venezuelensis TaxID=75913 RepID=A0A0K0FSL0_STRVS